MAPIGYWITRGHPLHPLERPDPPVPCTCLSGPKVSHLMPLRTSIGCHLSLHSSKSNTPISAAAVASPFLCPLSPWITQIFSSKLPPHSSCYHSPQLQQAFPGNPPTKPLSKAGKPVKQVGCFRSSFFLLSSISNIPNLIPSSVADHLLWLSLLFVPISSRSPRS